jgi:thymidylate synthase
MALAPCHAFFQFNTRSIPTEKRIELYEQGGRREVLDQDKLSNYASMDDCLNDHGIPKLYLDCQLYQRSVDSFL